MIRLLLLLTCCLPLTYQATAQQLPLPKSSPRAVVSQTIGLTDVTIEYHAPGVRNRQIWGNLVPYGQIWRAGANENTTIAFSDSVRINGLPVAPGKYSLFVLPDSIHDWQVILNRKTDHWGNEGYKAEDDVARFSTMPESAPFRETLGYWFSNARTGAAQLNLSWEKRTITVQIETDVHRKAVAGIRQTLAQHPDNWQLLAQAADYLIQHNIEGELALGYIDRAIALNDSYTTNWLKARLLAQKNDFSTAIVYARKAIKLGDKEDNSFRAQLPNMRVTLTQWQAKAY